MVVHQAQILFAKLLIYRVTTKNGTVFLRLNFIKYCPIFRIWRHWHLVFFESFVRLYYIYIIL